jgi:hypothetical protein
MLRSVENLPLCISPSGRTFFDLVPRVGQSRQNYHT